MRHRLSVRIGSLRDEYLITLTGLKENFKPNPERLLEIFKEIKE